MSRQHALRNSTVASPVAMAGLSEGDPNFTFITSKLYSPSIQSLVIHLRRGRSFVRFGGLTGPGARTTISGTALLTVREQPVGLYPAHRIECDRNRTETDRLGDHL